ncbi:MAG TPA: hypothetical protein VMK66_20070 [Myxococcales bacterium]|nr:hypothetical protein [Myxococcales bacterium]
MKWLLALLVAGAIAWAVAFVPPRTAAKAAARALRSGWDFIASLGPQRPRRDPAQHPPSRQLSHKSQASTPQRRASREGIVPQPPKETLRPNDRAALDSLVANSK